MSEPAQDLHQPASARQTPPILTVSQLTHAIKVQLESQFGQIRLQGEISNFKKQSSGHLYFSLKDQHAQVSAVMFRGNASQLQRLPKDGDQVILRGELSVYPPRGNYQLIVRELSYAGVGELLLKLEQLKVKLHKRGWFSAEHKKALPKAPKRIGIITSPTGAAIRDMLNVLNRRHAGLDIILNPVKVQGAGAAEEIARAIQEFNHYQLADVLIVGRGGGSIEDLWAFNEEIVAEAIFKSTIPIIGAVGHETDHCIAEYVADIRAPTPSAAAEIVTKEKGQMQQDLLLIQKRIQQTVLHLIGHSRHRLEGLQRQPVISSPYALVGPHMQRLDDLRQMLDQSTERLLQTLRLKLDGLRKQSAALQPLRQVEQWRQKLIQLERNIDHGANTRIRSAKQKLDPIERLKRLDLLMIQKGQRARERVAHLSRCLEAINPKNLLKKGYSIVFSEKEGSVITSSRTLEPQYRVKLLFADGEAAASIDQVKTYDESSKHRK